MQAQKEGKKVYFSTGEKRQGRFYWNREIGNERNKEINAKKLIHKLN